MPNSRPPAERLRAAVRGAVQGVGFRPFVHRLAGELNLKGWVANDAGGAVVDPFVVDASLPADLQAIVPAK